jgi:hypothetical protein
MLRRAILLGGNLAVLVGLAWAAGAEGQTPPTTKPKEITPPAKSNGAASEKPLVETLHRFDPRELDLRWNNRHWQVLHQGTVLKDFGIREQDARQALKLIHDLKLTEYGTIGTPQPVMEYWLSDGKAPQALALGGTRVLSLDENRLRVQQVNGQWCLGDGARVLYTFGAQADDARQALAVMHKYHFHQAAVLGQAGPSMVVFLGRSENEAPVLLPASRAASGRHIQVQRFSRLAKNSDGTPRREAGGTASSPFAGVVVPALPAAVRPATVMTSARPNGPAQQSAANPASSADPAAERVPFDWRQVQLKQAPSGEWRLSAGSQVLADFGTNSHEARLALSALRHYRFTEQYKVGGEQPVLTYYVAGGAAPRGLMMGLNGQAFQPDKLEVRQVDGRYCLCNDQQVVLRLGERSDEASRLLERIKTSHADRVSRVGDPGKEPMTLLLRSR